MSLASILNRNASYDEIRAELSRTQARVFDHLRGCGRHGATRHEIAGALRMPLASVCGRIAELEAAGLVRSDKDVRPTEYGGTATVVRAVDPHAPKEQLTLF